MIPLSIPEICGNEWAYLKECLDTNWVSSVGPFVTRFEEMVAKRTGIPHAVATSNGTAAIHTALLIAGVKAGDEVLVSDLTFIAPVNAVKYVGATPVFIDAEPHHAQMDTAALAEFLRSDCTHSNGTTTNKTTGRTVRAIIPVHVIGHTVDMTAIMSLAKEFGLVVIEDASECIGATLSGGTPAGSAGDIGCFSFNGNKTVTCGGGGMLVTRRRDWADYARYLTTQACDDRVDYIHNETGYNYRLTSLQAAMGCAQLENLDRFLSRKETIAAAYRSAVREIPGLALITAPEGTRSAWWLSTIRVDRSRFGMSSRQLLKVLADNNIQSRPLWQPMHLSPAHAHLHPRNCPVSATLHAECLSLPSSAGLTAADQEIVIAALRKAGSQPENSR